MPDKTEILYNNLKSDGYILPDVDTFKKNLRDTTASRTLYNNLVSDGYKLPDYETFKETVSTPEPVGKFSVEQNRGKSIDISRVSKPKLEGVEFHEKIPLGSQKKADVINEDKAYKSANNIINNTSKTWQTPSTGDILHKTIPIYGKTLEELYPDNYSALINFERSITGLSKEKRAALAFDVEGSDLPGDAKEQMQYILKNTEYVKDLQIENPLIESDNNVLQDLAVGLNRHTRQSLLASTAGLLDVNNPYGRIKDWWFNQFTGYGLEKKTASELVSEVTGKPTEESEQFIGSKSTGKNIGYMGEMAAVMWMTGGFGVAGENILGNTKAVSNVAKGYAKLIEGIKSITKGALKTGYQFEISDQLQAGRGEGFETGVAEYITGRAIGSMVNKILIKSFGTELSKKLPAKIAYRTAQLTGMTIGGVAEEMSGDIAQGASVSDLINDKHYMKELASLSLFLGLGSISMSRDLTTKHRQIFNESVNRVTDEMVAKGEIPESSKDEVVNSAMEVYDNKQYVAPAIDEIKQSGTEQINQQGEQVNGQEEKEKGLLNTAETQTEKTVTPGENLGVEPIKTPSVTEGEVEKQLYRGVGDNYSTDDNDAMTWYAEDIDVAKNYAEYNPKTNKYKIKTEKIKIPQNLFELPYKSRTGTHVKGSDIAGILRGDVYNKYNSGEITETQAKDIYNKIDKYEIAAGENMELATTKINKKNASKLFVEILSSIGYDGILQKESSSTTGAITNTYAIFKQNKLSTTTNKNIVLDKTEEKPYIEEKEVDYGTRKQNTIREIEDVIARNRKAISRVGKFGESIDAIENSGKSEEERTSEIANLLSTSVGFGDLSQTYDAMQYAKTQKGNVAIAEHVLDNYKKFDQLSSAIEQYKDELSIDDLYRLQGRLTKARNKLYHALTFITDVGEIGQENIIQKTTEWINDTQSQGEVRGVEPQGKTTVETNVKETGGKKAEADRIFQAQEKTLGMVGTSTGKTSIYGQPVINPKFKDSDLNNPIYLKSLSRTILQHLGMEEDIDVRTGLIKRFKNKAKALFFPNSNIIRLSTINDYSSLLHEVGHYIDMTLSGVTGKLNKSRDAHSNQIRKELKTLLKSEGYKSKKIEEGFAELTRLYVEEPAYAIEHAPTAYAYIDGIIKSDEKLNGLFNTLATKTKQYQAQDDRIKAEATISREHKDNGFISGITKFTDKFIYNFFDNVKYFRDLSDKISKTKTLPSQLSPLLNSLSVIGNAGKATQFIENHPYQRDGNNIILEKDIPGLLKIVYPIIKKNQLQKLEGYLVALRNVELIKNGKKEASTLPLDQSENVIKLYEQELGKEYLDGTRKQLDDYNDSLLRFYRDSGKINEETYQTIRKLNKYYIPFNRYFEEYERKGVQITSKQVLKDFTGNAIKRISGSERQIISPIESMLENTFKIVSAAENNRALSNIITALQSYEPNLVQLIPKNVIKQRMDTDGNLIYTIENQKPNTNIVTVYEDGKQKYYEIPKELHDSFFNLNSVSNDIVRFLSAPSRWLQAGAVSLDPTFGVRNIFRDQITAYFNSRFGYNPLMLPAGFAEYVKKDDVYQKWLASGGDFAFLTSLDEMLQDKEISKKAGRMQDKFIAKYKNPLELAQAFNRVTEIGTRIALFQNAYNKTGDVYLAMQEARTATGDYGVRGAALSSLLPFFPFMNARMQHQITTIRTMKNNPKQFILKGSIVAAPTILAWLWNNSDDDDKKLYQGLPAWRKLFLWNIQVPGQKWYVPIPKGFYGVLFGTSIESFLDYMAANDPRTIKDLPSSLLKEWAPVTSASELVPQNIRPILENQMNYNLFRQKQIVPEHMKRDEPSQQYTDETPQLYKTLGEYTNYPPLKIQNLFEGYGGGFVSGSVQISDYVGRKLGVFDDRIEPTFTSLSRLPVLKAFMTAEPTGKRSSYVDDFYKKLDELEGMSSTVNNYIEHNQDARLEKFMSDENRSKDYQWYLRNQTQINYFKNLLSGLRQLQNQIKKDNKTGYNEIINNLNEKISNTAIKFRDAYNNKQSFNILRDYNKELSQIKMIKDKEKIESKQQQIRSK